jgi:hypothetical protein
MVIPHKFRAYINQNDIKVLFLGTFNPEITCNRSTFFYGRSHNFFWQLVPHAFCEKSLKNSTDLEKRAFLTKNKIGLLDLISSVTVNDELELCSYGDVKLDRSFPQWNDDIFKLIDGCRDLRSIFLTRKTFQGIPNIMNRVSVIQKYACNKGIHVEVLVTPSRFTNEVKQDEWTKAISGHLARVNSIQKT